MRSRLRSDGAAVTVAGGSARAPPQTPHAPRRLPSSTLTPWLSRSFWGASIVVGKILHRDSRDVAREVDAIALTACDLGEQSEFDEAVDVVGCGIHRQQVVPEGGLLALDAARLVRRYISLGANPIAAYVLASAYNRLRMARLVPERP
jgi:hypothetical protein